jgi:hypothetical protein
LNLRQTQAVKWLAYKEVGLPIASADILRALFLGEDPMEIDRDLNSSTPSRELIAANEANAIVTRPLDGAAT